MNEFVVRNHSFVILIGLLFSLVFAANYVDIDEALLSYGIIFVLCVIATLLYVQWWIISGKPSVVYAWLMCLFPTVAYQNGWQFYARWVYIYQGTEAYRNVLDCRMWAWRSIPLEIVLVFMLCIIVGRMFGEQVYPGPDRRHHIRRADDRTVKKLLDKLRSAEP
jgi:hypothetical protein